MKLTCIFVCLSFLLQAQSIDFINIYFNNKTIGGINMEMDEDGNLYVIGTFQGTMDLNPGAEEDIFTSDAKSFFISRYNSDGEVDWIKVIGENCNAKDITIDKNGDLLVVGQFEGEVNFDPGTTDYILDSGSNSIFGYVFKLDAEGNALRVNRFQCVFGEAEATLVRTDEENNVIIAGTYNQDLNVDLEPFSFSLLQSPIGFDAFIVKYDSNFSLKWKESLGWTSGGAWIEDIHIDEEGDVYVLGHFTGTLDFDEDDQVDSDGGHDIFMAKHPRIGSSWSWYKSYGGDGNDVANTLLYNQENNNFWIGGHFDQDIQFEINGASTNYPADEQKGLLIATDTNGEVESLIPFEGGKGQIVSLSKSNTDNVLVYGNFSESLNLGNTTLQTASPSALFIAEMDYNGSFLSGIKLAESANFQFGVPLNNFREYESFLANENGDIFFSGDFSNPSSISIESPVVDINTIDYCFNGVVLKIANAFTTNTNEVISSLGGNFSVFPNPSENGILKINGDETLSQIRIFSIQGDLVFQKDFPETSLDLSKLSSGLYFVEMEYAESMVCRRWVKM